MFQLLEHITLLQVLTNEYKLILSGSIFWPGLVIDAEAGATKVENMPVWTFGKPQDPLPSKHTAGQVVEEIFKASQAQGASTSK